jgi:hypothetical protein
MCQLEVFAAGEVSNNTFLKNKQKNLETIFLESKKCTHIPNIVPSSDNDSEISE